MPLGSTHHPRSDPRKCDHVHCRFRWCINWPLQPAISQPPPTESPPAFVIHEDEGDGELTDRVPPRRRLGDRVHSAPEPEEGEVSRVTLPGCQSSCPSAICPLPTVTLISEHNATGPHEEPHQTMPSPFQAGTVHCDDDYRGVHCAQVGDGVHEDE